MLSILGRFLAVFLAVWPLSTSHRPRREALSYSPAGRICDTALQTDGADDNVIQKYINVKFIVIYLIEVVALPAEASA
jgi:hypothetical protein